MEVEIDAAHRAFLIALAKDDSDEFVQRDTVAHSRPTVFVSGNGLLRQRLQRRLEIFGSLIHANDVLVISFYRGRNFPFECIYRHVTNINQPAAKKKIIFSPPIPHLYASDCKELTL